MDESEQHRHLKGSVFEVDIRKMGERQGNRIRVRLPIQQVTAVILYPSLTCPAMVREGEPIRLLIGTTDTFYDIHRQDIRIKDAAGNESSRMLLRQLAMHLKITPFGDSVEQKIKPLREDKPLAGNLETAAAHLAVQYLGRLQGYAFQTLGRGEHFRGNLHPETLRHCANNGITRLFQVEYHNHGLTAGATGTLYDLSWLNYKPGQQYSDNGYYEPQDTWTLKFLDEDPYIKDSDFKFEIDVDSEHIDFTTKKDRPIRNFHPVWIGPRSKKVLNPGHLTDVHVSSRQHAFRMVKPQLIPGHSPELGRLVNTSFDTLRDLMDQFGQDQDIDFLFFTGDLVDYNRNYNPTPFIRGEKHTTGELWQAMNLDKLNDRDENGNPVRDKKGRIQPNTREYPRGIDNAVMYSLFLRFMRKYNKPIFLVSGNHEAYSVPYGISARVHLWNEAKNAFKSGEIERRVEITRDQQREKRDELSKGKTNKGFARANSGMPADHNLTIPEAILLYGPDYDRVVIGNNFNSSNLDWFYTVFASIQDFYFTWGEQCFIGLGWGNAERYLAVGHGMRYGAILPWATESITDEQLRLLESAINKAKKTNILGCHFTIANYDTNIPIEQEGNIYYHVDENVDYSELASALKLFSPSLMTNKAKELARVLKAGWRRISHYSEGTFTNNRKTFYRLIASENKIHHTLSGHSHRAGRYRIIDNADGILFKRVSVKGEVPHYENGKYAVNAKGPNILVSASGGPIPVQNVAGELAGNGLDMPSGTYIKFDVDAQAREIGIKRSTVRQARPRLAVALDYADLLGAEDKGIGPLSTRFEQETDNGPFLIEINPKMGLPDTPWIERIQILKRAGRRVIVYSGSLRHDSKLRRYLLEIPGIDIIKELKQSADYSYYVQIEVSSKIRESSHFAVYDTQHAWIWQADIVSRQEKALRRLHDALGMATRTIPRDFIEMREAQIRRRYGGLQIRRNQDFGEIPDLRSYSDYYGEEYEYPWKTRKKSGDPKAG